MGGWGREVLFDLTFCLAGSFSAHSAEEGQAGLGVLHFIPFCHLSGILCTIQRLSDYSQNRISWKELTLIP